MKKMPNSARVSILAKSGKFNKASEIDVIKSFCIIVWGI